MKLDLQNDITHGPPIRPSNLRDGLGGQALRLSCRPPSRVLLEKALESAGGEVLALPLKICARRGHLAGPARWRLD